MIDDRRIEEMDGVTLLTERGGAIPRKGTFMVATWMAERPA